MNVGQRLTQLISVGAYMDVRPWSIRRRERVPMPRDNLRITFTTTLRGFH
jgi:hypothetical protein